MNLLKLLLWAISEWIKKKISAEDRQFQQRLVTEYLKTSPWIWFAIRLSNLMMCRWADSLKLERNCHARGKSIIWPGFYVSQLTAHQTTQMQSTLLWMMQRKPCKWNSLLESQMPRENSTQLSFCQPTANVHTIITLPSRLWNSVF